MRTMTLRTTTFVTFAASLAMITGATTTHAALIAGITASASTEFNATNTPASKTIDGSGMTGSQADTDVQQSWFSNGLAGGANVAEEWIQWDLGGLYLLDSIQVWNCNQTSGGNVTDRGINQVDIYYSAVAVPGDPEGAGAANWSVLKLNANLAQAPGLTTYTGFDLATQIATALPASGIQWVRFEVDSNFGGGPWASLAEIRFSGETYTAVPAPAALPAGLALLGTLAVRRRRTS